MASQSFNKAFAKVIVETRKIPIDQMLNWDAIADYADALGLKPRSKPLSLAKAKKAVERLYRPRKAKSVADRVSVRAQRKT